MAGQRKASEDRKAEIVRAAIRLAAEKGPDRISAQMLADAVGVSQPAVFKHFRSMADIWQAVGEDITRDMRIEFAAPPAGQARDTLIKAIEGNLQHIMRNPAIPAILFSRELHAENEALRRRFEEVMAHRRQGFAGLISKAQAEGGVAAAPPAEDLAALILAVIQGLAMRWSLENRRFDLGREGRRLILAMLGDGGAAGPQQD